MRGNRCPAGEAWNADFRKLCAESAIVVADNFLNDIPGYWSDRVYLAQACGAFVLHPDVPGYTESATYARNHYEDLIAQCRYWLDHPEEREQRRTNEHARCLATDSYAQRCRALIEEVQRIRG